jgi:nucleoid-associated protein YgaU
MVGEHMFVRILIIVGIAVLAWSAVARSSQAHGAKQVVTVHPYDTLWSIAQRHYGGDVRDAIWRIERANHLASADVRAGQRLVLP